VPHSVSSGSPAADPRASVTSDGLLAVMMWWMVWAMCRREDRQRADATSSLVAVAGVAPT
jgi:hypothetical protein